MSHRPSFEWLHVARAAAAAERPVSAGELLAVWRIIYAVACLVRLASWKQLLPELQVGGVHVAGGVCQYA